MRRDRLGYLLGNLCVALITTSAFAEPKKTDDKGAATECNVSVEVKVGTGVENHVIVGEAGTFSKGTTVWAWSRISCGPEKIKHVWKRDGNGIWTATLPVGSKEWSTMSRRLLSTVGSYEVEVTSIDGVSLGKVSFTIQ